MEEKMMLNSISEMKMTDTSDDSCVVCGGDRIYTNAFGSRTACPGCGGTGKKNRFVGLGNKDVTKTKVRGSNSATKPPRPTHPTSALGLKLEGMVQKQQMSTDKRSRIINQIIDFEETKGSVTQTFFTKVRKEHGLQIPS
jgi:hypothetical protein